jgi:HAD superfamily hydrolase (TIGR01484 family)
MSCFSQFASEKRVNARVLLFDIDDTLTTDGTLTAAAYAAIARAHEAGLITIPITGRPAGWCDHIARMWPVDAVVGENGAFWFRYDRAARTLQRCFALEDATRRTNRARLDAIAHRIIAAVPGAALASDQAYREADIAIDFCEDVPRLGEADVARIRQMMLDAGLTAKVSSIHVNGWFGDYDKLSTTRKLLREAFAFDADANKDAVVFVGDSPNDEPMFAFFPHAVGVANVRDFVLASPPAYVTEARAGLGFVEVVDGLVAARRQ